MSHNPTCSGSLARCVSYLGGSNHRGQAPASSALVFFAPRGVLGGMFQIFLGTPASLSFCTKYLASPNLAYSWQLLTLHHLEKGFGRNTAGPVWVSISEEPRSHFRQVYRPLQSNRVAGGSSIALLLPLLALFPGSLPPGTAVPLHDSAGGRSGLRLIDVLWISLSVRVAGRAVAESCPSQSKPQGRHLYAPRGRARAEKERLRACIIAREPITPITGIVSGSGKAAFFPSSGQSLLR